MNTCRFLLAAIIVFSLSNPGHARHEQNTDAYKFGVFPYMSAVRMDRIFTPITEELGNILQHRVLFRTSSTLDRFFDNLKAQHYDFALIGPLWYPVAVDNNNYVPIARIMEPLASSVMVLQDSPITNVQDLRGMVIGTPRPTVPIVVMAKHALKSKGLEPGEHVKLTAFKNVDSCFQQLLIGKVDACVAPPFAPAAYESAMKVKLRSVLKSFEIPNLSLVVHSRIPEEVRAKVEQNVMSWSKTEKGRELLGRLNTAGFVPVTDADYDKVREFIFSLDAR